MSATPTAAVKASPSTRSSGPSTEARRADADTAPEQKFDRRLDAARKQHDSGATAGEGVPAEPVSRRMGPSRDAEPLQLAKKGGAVARTPDDFAEGDASKDAGALAAMLALLGQAGSATPLAAATSAALGVATPGANAHALDRFGLPDKPAEPGKLPDGKAAALPPFSIGSEAVAQVAVDATHGTPVAFADLLAPATADATDRATDLQDLAGLVTTAGIAPQAMSHTAAPPAMSIASPVGSHGFATDLGHQITWLGMQDIKQARIRLHPQELGSLDVNISVHHNQVDVSFVVQHPAAAHAVQQSLAQLDSMLAQHGLSLGQADVGRHQSGGGQSSASPADAGAAALDAVDDAGATLRPLSTTALPGLLDTFA